MGGGSDGQITRLYASAIANNHLAGVAVLQHLNDRANPAPAFSKPTSQVDRLQLGQRGQFGALCGENGHRIADMGPRTMSRLEPIPRHRQADLFGLRHRLRPRREQSQIKVQRRVHVREIIGQGWNLYQTNFKRCGGLRTHLDISTVKNGAGMNSRRRRRLRQANCNADTPCQFPGVVVNRIGVLFGERVDCRTCPDERIRPILRQDYDVTGFRIKNDTAADLNSRVHRIIQVREGYRRTEFHLRGLFRCRILPCDFFLQLFHGSLGAGVPLELVLGSINKILADLRRCSHAILDRFST